MLEGKRILVTGAGRGIGRAIARAAAREGAVVGVHHLRSRAEAEALCAEIEEAPRGRAHRVCFDVRDPAAVGRGVEAFCAAEGGIDGLVNNAGILAPGLFATLPADRIGVQIETNLLGPIHCIQAVLPAMLRRRGGVVVTISSVSAARPNRGQAVYAATKGAVEALTRALAVEYARKGIRFSCVRPGPIETAMLEGTRQLAGAEVLRRIPCRRLGTPEEVAGLCCFLLSDRAGFMTGDAHAVDGGYLLG